MRMESVCVHFCMCKYLDVDAVTSAPPGGDLRLTECLNLV